MRPEHPIVLITGASSGLGAATARLLAAQGCPLALGARRVERVRALAEELAGEHGVPTFTQALDTRSTASVQAFVEGAVAALGGLHVVVANAGLAKGTARLDSVLEEDWQAMLHTNVEGVIRTIKTTLPHVRQSGWGHYFTIGSTAGHSYYEGGAAYCASKHALLGFARSLAMEVKPRGIHVYNLCPGGVDTDFIKGTCLGERLKGQPMINPENIAEMAVFLLRQPENIDMAEVTVRRFDPKAK